MVELMEGWPNLYSTYLTLEPACKRFPIQQRQNLLYWWRVIMKTYNIFIPSYNLVVCVNHWHENNRRLVCTPKVKPKYPECCHHALFMSFGASICIRTPGPQFKVFHHVICNLLSFLYMWHRLHDLVWSSLQVLLLLWLSSPASLSLDLYSLPASSQSLSPTFPDQLVDSKSQGCSGRLKPGNMYCTMHLKVGWQTNPHQQRWSKSTATNSGGLLKKNLTDLTEN